MQHWCRLSCAFLAEVGLWCIMIWTVPGDKPTHCTHIVMNCLVQIVCKKWQNSRLQSNWLTLILVLIFKVIIFITLLGCKVRGGTGTWIWNLWGSWHQIEGGFRILREFIEIKWEIFEEWEDALHCCDIYIWPDFIMLVMLVVISRSILICHSFCVYTTFL